MNGEILLQICFNALCVRVWLGLVPNVADENLLGTSFIERFIRGMLLSRLNTIP